MTTTNEGFAHEGDFCVALFFGGCACGGVGCERCGGTALRCGPSVQVRVDPKPARDGRHASGFGGVVVGGGILCVGATSLI
jgi:hypothetical protein